MPELCRFLGMIIRMYWNDHAPSHFHVLYGNLEATFSIESLAIIDGKLPPRVRALVVEWAALHQDELRENWKRAREEKDLLSIQPLE